MTIPPLQRGKCIPNNTENIREAKQYTNAAIRGGCVSIVASTSDAVPPPPPNPLSTPPFHLWNCVPHTQFKAMRMDNAYLVADGEGGVLGFTAARALKLRGYYVSYADTSGDGVR